MERGHEFQICYPRQEQSHVPGSSFSGEQIYAFWMSLDKKKWSEFYRTQAQELHPFLVRRPFFIRIQRKFLNISYFRRFRQLKGTFSFVDTHQVLR